MSAQTKKILIGVVVALVLYHFYMQSQVAHVKGGEQQ